MSHDEAFKALDETEVFVPPSVPPPASDTADTHPYLAPCVPTFFQQRCCHPAGLPLPLTSQHAATVEFERLDRTLDIGPPSSGVRATPSPCGASDTPASTAASGPGGLADLSGGGLGVLPEAP